MKAEIATKKRVARVEAKRARYIINGVDWDKELRKYALLPVFGGRKKGVPYTRIKNGLLKLIIHRCVKMQRSLIGRYDGDVHVYTWPGQSNADIRLTLLHELVHCIYDGGHDKGFFRKERVAVRQANRRFGKLEGRINYKYLNRIMQEDTDSDEGTDKGRIRGSDAAVLTGNPLAGLPAAA